MLSFNSNQLMLAVARTRVFLWTQTYPTQTWSRAEGGGEVSKMDFLDFRRFVLAFFFKLLEKDEGRLIAIFVVVLYINCL